MLTKHRTYWQNSAVSASAKEYLQKYFYIDTSPYDIIRGYRADDSYFSFAQDFISGTISLRKLSEAMKLGKLGEQIVLMSKDAFDNLSFTGSESADAATYWNLKNKRDSSARASYLDGKNMPDSYNELFIIDIMREEIKNGDPRLQ